jgi:hypothetical protein
MMSHPYGQEGAKTAVAPGLREGVQVSNSKIARAVSGDTAWPGKRQRDLRVPATGESTVNHFIP